MVLLKVIFHVFSQSQSKEKYVPAAVDSPSLAQLQLCAQDNRLQKGALENRCLS